MAAVAQKVFEVDLSRVSQPFERVRSLKVFLTLPQLLATGRF